MSKSRSKSKSKNKRKRKRKALGEELLGKRGTRQNRYLMSKRRVAGEEPYAWIGGKAVKKKVKRKRKRKRKKIIKPAKRRRPYKLKAKKIVKKLKPPAKIWNKLKEIEKGMVLLPKEIVAVAKATGEVTRKVTADVSKMIASAVVTGQKEASKIIQRVQWKFKAEPLKSRIENLFGILGKECYRLIGKKKNILKEKKIKNLINQIKDYQKRLQRVGKEFSS